MILWASGLLRLAFEKPSRRDRHVATFFLLTGLLISLKAAAQTSLDGVPPPGVVKIQKLETIEVIATQPLPGLGLSLDRATANVQGLGEASIKRGAGQSLPDILNTSLPSVSLHGVLGNQFQPDLSYRGFTASPLLGTPQGIGVFVDGMRLNEPFGDVVNWDLIPQIAISGVQLIPGSNPLFGLNTLGGALVMRTKSGDTNPGVNASAGTGSYNARSIEAELGNKHDRHAWYVAGSAYAEDGWRQFSQSRISQAFAKYSFRGEQTDLDFSFAAADNRLYGNGYIPLGLLKIVPWNAVYTNFDKTNNVSQAISLIAKHDLDARSVLTAQSFYRRNRQDTLNRDVNQIRDGRFNVVPYEEDPQRAQSASSNQGHTKQGVVGLSLQWVYRFTNGPNMTLGASLDAGHAAYRRSYALGEFTANRGVESTLPTVDSVDLAGHTVTQSAYTNWQIPLGAYWQMTATARFNDTRVKTRDRLVPALPPPAKGLDNDFRYRILNPALGLSYSAKPGWSAYTSISQGSRAPNPVELACADREAPCLLPNAMASDPYLRAVITGTAEVGLRGLIPAPGSAARWYASWYRADNRDDILFVSSGNGAGYFTNFGKTRRQGVEVGAAGKSRPAEGSVLDWGASYARNDAKFQSRAVLLSENNSSRGSVAGLRDNEIEVLPGDRVPGIPLHQFKFWGELALPAALKIGLELTAVSSEIARGNENNRHRAGIFTNLYGQTQTYRAGGSVPGRAVLNFNAGWQASRQWELFVRVNNLFDQRYFSAAVLGNNAFPAGSFERNPDLWQRDLFAAPGAVRTVFAGLRWTPNHVP